MTPKQAFDHFASRFMVLLTLAGVLYVVGYYVH